MTKQPRLRVQRKKGGRRGALYLLLLAAFGAITYQVQQRYHVVEVLENLLTTAKKTFSQATPVRGTIYDRNLKPIAVNKERVSVYVRTREIDSIPDTAEGLGTVLGLDKEKLKDKLEGGVLRLWVAEDISQEQEVAVVSLGLPGVYLQSEDKRFYPNGTQAAHLIGYVDDGIGLSGVEYYYDRLLANRKSKQQEERQPLSRAQDLILTIDLKIQGILEQLVADISDNEQADKIAAYILDGGTGEIVGGAQLPGFNPNSFTRYSQNVLGNMFLEQMYLPEKFRLFIRDTASLQVHIDKGNLIPAWSLCPDQDDLGSQLRLWERLGLSDSTQTDFYIPSSGGEQAESAQSSVISTESLFGLVPESTTPLNLLTAYSSLLSKGVKKQPFVLKKILDIKTGKEVLVSKGIDLDSQFLNSLGNALQETVRLFRSMARERASQTFFLRDQILLSGVHRGRHQLMVNDLTYVTIPAGKSDLNMLIVVQRTPEGVEGKIKEKKRSLEEMVEEKVARISVLQQVAMSVADVVEREKLGDDNYQGKQRSEDLKSKSSENLKREAIPKVMPDLKGLSLRKSLRLLQGLQLKINIQGTGRVVDQKPRPGTSLVGIKECILTLEKTEHINLENMSKGVIPKK